MDTRARVEAYMVGVADQITAAVRDGNTEATKTILARVADDGYNAAAREFAKGVRNTSLDDPTDRGGFTDGEEAAAAVVATLDVMAARQWLRGLRPDRDR